MAKNVQDLRREKGYRSAREFAEALGIAVSTYARYESQPDAIPLKQAWAIADKLGCTIDMVVGRDDSNFTDLRGKVQQFYDGLSMPSRRLFREMMEYIEYKEQQYEERQRQEAERRMASMARFYDRLFTQSLYDDAEPDAIMVFDDQDETREAFRAFLLEKVPERRRANAEKEARSSVKRRIEMQRRRAEDMERSFTEPSEEELQRMISSSIDSYMAYEEEKDGTVEEVVEKILEMHDKLGTTDVREEPIFRYRF